MIRNPFVEALYDSTLPRPYFPILGTIACELGQVTEVEFRTNPQVQAVALQQVATALGADGFVVGWRSSPDVGVEVVQRLRPIAGRRAVIACVGAEDVAGARRYLEVGVDVLMLMLLDGETARDSKLRIIGNAARHYGAPTILVDPADQDVAQHAESAGLDGSVGTNADAAAPGIVGGGLALDGTILSAPRSPAFFWTFSGEVPLLQAEALVAIGDRLASQPCT